MSQITGHLKEKEETNAQATSIDASSIVLNGSIGPYL